MTVRTEFGVASRITSSQFIAGLECEIEDLSVAPYDTDVWNMVEDGSLRNNGHEFVSKPLPKDVLIAGFLKLHQSLEYNTSRKEDRFSSRTSIHVHVNCLDLEMEQVKSIAMWYALFEPLFFTMVHPSRRNNIHCVELRETVLSESYRRPLNWLHAHWSKYTALNLLPLNKYGTIEFRHMEGMDDVERLTQWLDTIDNLWTFAKDNPLDRSWIINDRYYQAFDVIFKDAPDVLKLKDALPVLLADAVVDIKLSLS